MTEPTGPASLAGLLRSLPRRAWDRLTRTVWIVRCDWCWRAYGAEEADLPGLKFRRREDADAAVRSVGGIVDGDRWMCPPCRPAAAPEARLASRPREAAGLGTAMTMPLVLTAITYLIGYYLSLRIWPDTACRKCGGSGRNAGSNEKRWGYCRKCKRSGRQWRLGVRLFMQH